MKIKTSELTGAALDWAVAKSMGGHIGVANGVVCFNVGDGEGFNVFTPSTDWAQGGPILSEARISRTIDHSGLWVAYWTDGYTEGDEGKKWMHCDKSELIAGLRCVVEKNLGNEVEVPDELV